MQKKKKTSESSEHKVPLCYALSILLIAFFGTFLCVVAGVAIYKSENSPSSAYSPAWSPDGTQLAFASDMIGAGIWLMNSDGSSIKPLVLDGNAASDFPSWSPDGRYITYQAESAQGYDIWIISVKGTEATNLTASMGSNERMPTWSPDGEHIAFMSNSAGNEDIWVISVSTGQAQNLTANHAYTDAYPSWAGPNCIVYTGIQVQASLEVSDIQSICLNGEANDSLTSNGASLYAELHLVTNKLVLVGRQPGTFDIYVVENRASAVLQNLTANVQNPAHEPTWSPDGSRIAFVLTENEKQRILTMNADGSDITELRPPTFFYWLPYRTYGLPLIALCAGSLGVIGLIFWFSSRPKAGPPLPSDMVTFE
jgi:Tol biopolymer transport system component